MSAPVPKTPCVGLCSTVYGDLICRGCKRFYHEVVHWNAYSDAQKQAVLQRLEKLVLPLLERRFEVRDSALLQQRLQQQGIPFNASQSPYCWILPLLARRARQIGALEGYGLALREEASGQSLPELRAAIESEFFALSEAYYRRYHAL